MATSFLIPDFNWSNQFTYMHDLIEDTKPPRAVVPWRSIAGQQKITLYEDSSAYLKQAVYEIMNKNTEESPINSALNFLKEAANSERNKELKALETYKKELDDFPQNWKDNEKFKKIYDKIKSIDLQNLNNNSKKLEEFYLNLTAAINLIRKEEKEYLARLEQIVQKNNKRQRDTRTILASDQYKYRAHGDIVTLFRNMSGIAEQSQADSLSNKIVSFVLKYVEKFKIDKRNMTEDKLFAVCGLILVDVERFIQEEYYNSMKDNELPEKITNEMAEKAFERYLNVDKQQMTRLQKDIIEQDNVDLERLIKSAKSLFGIKKITEIEKIKQRQQALEKQQKSKTLGSNRNAFYRHLKKSLKNSKTNKKTDLKNFELITWEAKTNQSHYKIDEIVNVLAYNAFSTAGTSAGSDTIVIGTVTGKINHEKLRKKISLEMDEMQKSIENYYNEISFNNRSRKDSYEQYFTQLNDSLSKEIEKIKKDLEYKQSNIKNLFVYHESLKLYSQVEMGKKNYFHGRDLNVLNAFDQLYSAATLDAFKMPHRDILTTIAANLSELAVGKNLKNTLEKYFSIFAGLLMFDDIRNIAKDAKNTIDNEEEKTVHQIHLYKVNDQYIPSSMVLTNIYNAIKNQGIITAERAAKAEINIDEANKTIRAYLNKRNQGEPYKLEEWDSIADEVIQGTQIQITFLASFIQFLKSLSEL